VRCLSFGSEFDSTGKEGFRVRETIGRFVVLVRLFLHLGRDLTEDYLGLCQSVNLLGERKYR
jgi:hypothetical protein